MTSTTLSGLGLAQGPRLRPGLLERQPADLRRAGDLPRRHRLRQRPVRRRQVRHERRQEHDRGRQPPARRRQRRGRRPGHARPRRAGEADRHASSSTPTARHGDSATTRHRPDAAAAVRLEGPGLPGRPAGPHLRLRRRPGRSWASRTTTSTDTQDNTRHAPERPGAHARPRSTRRRSTCSSPKPSTT